MTIKLWWISVAGSKCEPARVEYEGDKPKGFYSIGCQDLHPLAGVVLVKEIKEEIPYTPAAQKAQETLAQKAWEARGAGYRYRKFD